MKLKHLLIYLVLFLSLTFITQATWWNTSWGYRTKLTFDNSQQNYNLSNFTVMVKLNTTNFNYSLAKTDASDIRFIDSDNTTNLAWHVDVWDTSSNSWLWVKVPNIPNSSSTDYIWLYYNNSAAVDNQNESGTYDEYFIAVWHLNESTGTVWDSTSHSHDATNNDAKYNTSSYIGGGYFVDTNNDYLYVGDTATLDQDELTIEAMVNGAGSGNNLISCIVDKRDSANDGYALRKSSDNDWEIKANSAVSPTAPAITYGQWYYVVGSKTSNKLRIYYDARWRGTTTSSQSISTTQDLTIGNNAYHYANPGYSSFDEIRISKIARHYRWINASWRTITNQFLTYSAQESAPEDASATLTLASSLVNATKNYNTESLNFTYNGTFANHDTDLANCSFYQEGIFNQTLNDVNLTLNNLYNISFRTDYTGTYNISFNCTSGAVNDTFDTVYYFVDLLAPPINQPTANNTQYLEGTTATFYFNTSDTNLHAYNRSLLNSNFQVWQNQNVFLENITTTFAENSTTVLLNETGNFTFFIQSWDSHTGNIITNYSWEKYSANISGKIYKGIAFAGNKFNMSSDTYQYLEHWELIKTTDRYILNMTFNQTGFWMKLYYQSRKPLKPLYNSSYQGHLLVENNHWIDHVPENNDSIENFTLTHKANFAAYQGKFYVKNESVVFHSIGVLNYNSKGYDYEVLPESTPTLFNCGLNSSATLTCFEQVRLSCNVTDTYALNQTNFTIDGVNNQTFNISGSEFYYDISSTENNSNVVWNWTTATSCNTWGDCNTTNVNIEINYSCIWSDYINITNVQSSGITYNQSTITWLTSHSSDTNVSYNGQRESLGQLVTSHNVTIYNLINSTTYFYNVTSTRAPVTATSKNYNFTTPQTPGSPSGGGSNNGGGGSGSSYCGNNICSSYETEESCPEDCVIIEPVENDLTVSFIEMNKIWFTVETQKFSYDLGEDISITLKTYLNNKLKNADQVDLIIKQGEIEFDTLRMQNSKTGTYLLNYPNLLSKGNYDFEFEVKDNDYTVSATRDIIVADQSEVINYVFEPSGTVKPWVLITIAGIIVFGSITMTFLFTRNKKGGKKR